MDLAEQRTFRLKFVDQFLVKSRNACHQQPLVFEILRTLKIPAEY